MIGSLFQVFSKYQSVRGGLGSLPIWGRWLLLIAALPGVALAGLSILALGVSILALLVLTVPVYRLVRWVSGGNSRCSVRSSAGSDGDFELPDGAVASKVDIAEVMQAMLTPTPTPQRRRHVDVTIIDDGKSRFDELNHRCGEVPD